MSATRLELSNDMEELDRLATGLEEFGNRNGLSADLVGELNLVLEEIVTNTFSYGADDGRAPESVKAWIDIAVEGGEVRVRVADTGRPYDPLANFEAPDLGSSLEEREVGGLGVHLVKKLMDEVRYQHEGGRNVLEMRRRIS